MTAPSPPTSCRAVTIDTAGVGYLDSLGAAARGHKRTENLPVALRVPPRAARTVLRAVYGFARLVDEIGDSADGDRTRLLELLELDLRAAPRGTARVRVVRALAPYLASKTVPLEPLLDLIEANRLDQTVTSYAGFADLLAYCRLSAAPIGRVVLHAARAASPDNIAASDQVCAALQILEHCQNVGADARAGRVYLPADDLAAAGVRPEELHAPTTAPALRSVVAVQVSRCRVLLAGGGPLIARLHGWARIAVVGYVAGGLATADALEHAHGEVLAAPVSAGRTGRAARAARAVPLLVARRPAVRNG